MRWLALPLATRVALVGIGAFALAALAGFVARSGQLCGWLALGAAYGCVVAFVVTVVAFVRQRGSAMLVVLVAAGAGATAALFLRCGAIHDAETRARLFARADPPLARWKPVTAAIHAYEREHGRPPESLDVLSPQVEIPRTPRAEYEARDDGWTLALRLPGYVREYVFVRSSSLELAPAPADWPPAFHARVDGWDLYEIDAWLRTYVE